MSSFRSARLTVVAAALAAIGYAGSGLIVSPAPAATCVAAIDAPPREGEPAPPALRVRSLTADERPERVREALESAIEWAERGDLEKSRLAYAEAQVLSRGRSGPLSRLSELEQRYREAYLAQALFVPIREAFEREDFPTALALLYRLPEDADPARVRRGRANGWYNLAVVALRAGRCEEAARDLAEAVAADGRPRSDSGAAAIAELCRRARPDRGILARAERLEFRGLED